MDKYEFKLSLEEINKLIQQRRYDEAADIADGIDWNHVGNADTLRRVSEVYKAVGDYDRSRSVMAIARKRQPDNPAIIYSLCELTIFLYGRDGLQDDLTDSLQMMQEYQMLQPENPKRLILQYKMYGVSGASVSEKITVLEQLKKENFTARWGYELAKCYAEAGEQAQAAELAVEVSEIFGGRYGNRARQLADSLALSDSPAAPSGRTADSVRGPMREKPAARPVQAPTPVQDREPAEEESRERPSAAGPAPEERGPEEDADVRTWSRSTRTAEEPPESPVQEEPAWQQAEKEPDADGGPGFQTGRQASIDEVMAEWEKIRSDIRRANDEKRAQRILEDTGSLLNSFDETARHGLLEDIEKGVARQRRQVRSGAYRVSPDAYDDAGRAPADEVGRTRYDDQYDRDSYRREEEETVRRPAPRREYDEEEDQYDDRRGDRRDNRYEDQYETSYESRRGRYGDAYDDGREEAVSAPRRAEAVPVSNDDDDVRIYGRTAEVDNAETRRWNSEEVHRSAMRRPQYREDARGRKRIVISEEPEEPRQESPASAYDAEEPVREPRGREEEPVDQVSEDAFEETVRRIPAPEKASESAQPEEPEDAYLDEPEREYPEEPEPEQEPVRGPQQEDRSVQSAAQEEEEEEPVRRLQQEQTVRRAAVQEAQEPVRDSESEEEPVPAPRPRRGRVRRMSAGEQPYGPQDEETVKPEEPVREEETTSAPRGARQEQEPPASETAQETTAAAAAGESEAPSGKRELTREERRLFGPFCRMTENVSQLTEALDQISLASSTGNLLILGNEATADRVARGILEIVRHSDANFTGRIARATGESLNKLDAKGFSRTFAKLESGALIVTKAADIAPKTLERMHAELERDHGVILILTDVNKKMEVFRRENGQYLGSFTAVINIRPLDDKALVAYARDYALSKDYSIDEFGQLALAQRISSMQTPTHHVTLKEVRDLVDEAISYASRKGPGTVMEVLSRKRRDENDRIILHEKDFTHY